MVLANLERGPAYPPGTAYPVSTASPKEIGVMQRLDGVRSGVSEIEVQLRAFISALQGTPAPQNPNMPVSQPGITGVISDTEASIRETLSMLRQLADSF